MSSNDTNEAAWLDAAGSPFNVRSAPFPTPGPDDVVVRIHAIAINPTDSARQAQGMAVPTYPYVIGCDGAGIVTAVGSQIKHVKVGDRAIVQSDEFFTQKASRGIFQRYVLTGSTTVCKIPDALSFEEGTVLPLAISTAAGALLEKASLDLDWPRLKSDKAFDEQKKKHAGEVLIVWGGSSSVGACAIQLVTAAGYRVIATSSPRNFDLLRECGAEATFDHTQDDCIDQICEWVEKQGLQSAGVASVVIDQKAYEKCGEIARRLPGRKWVATTLARGIMPEPDLGEGIKTSACFAISQPDLAEYLWNDWIAKALAAGELKCLPKPDVVGKGIGAINQAVEIMGKGVSGKKLVVNGI